MNPLIRLLWPFYQKYKLLGIAGILFVAAVNLLALYPGWVTGKIIDILTEMSRASSYLEALRWIGLYLGSLFLFSLLRAALMVGMRLTLVVLSRRVEREHRAYLLERIFQWDFSTFRKYPIGELMTHFTEDLNRLRNFTGPVILYGLQVVFLTLFTAAMMFYTNWKLACLSLFPLGLIGPLTYALRRQAIKRGIAQQAAFAQLSAFLQQVYSYLRPLKAIADPSALSAKWHQLSKTHKEASLSVTQVETYLQPLAMLFVGLSLTSVLIYGGILVAKGQVSLGIVSAFSLYILQLMFPLGAIGWLISLVQQARVSAERLLALQELMPEIVFPSISLRSPSSSAWQWEGLSFRYTDGQSWLFKDFSGRIESAQKIALSLPIGAGKTTLARLLTRQLDPQKGRIFFGGVPLVELSRRDLRRWIGYVPQQPVLLSGSIIQNLRWVKPEASIKELWSVLEGVGLAEEIHALPKGLHTDIGVWGQQVSGGQRQRLALAMVLLLRPMALILDETFAPLDTEKIQEILTYLKANFGHATWLVFSHRIEVRPFVDVWGESFQILSSSPREIGAR
ncbi:MAG: ABC transporter ATP-binding protein [Bacteroidia bacterium]|nr:ABC transporter ATP-binding protein/permease [Bacteroidia bacterium]MDW8133943.1 ABC transporter ATP-binding protein [Bacteroidia bacterium]